MIALALISMLSCTSKELTAKTIREGERRSASARSREDVSSSLVLVVEATPGIPNAIVRGALNEATAIWGAAGVAIEWRPSSASSLASETSAVRVMLGDARGSVSSHDLPLGWINFNSAGVPEGIVYLSHANVVQLLDAAAAYRNRPTSYRELLAARALGRALAHELGHYLTGSKAHSPSGLMKAHRQSDELFSPARTEFMLDVDERQLTAKALTPGTPHANPATEVTIPQCDDAAPPVCCDAGFFSKAYDCIVETDEYISPHLPVSSDLGKTGDMGDAIEAQTVGRRVAQEEKGDQL